MIEPLEHRRLMSTTTDLSAALPRPAADAPDAQPAVYASADAPLRTRHDTVKNSTNN
jgi:hypothetical protein